MEVSLSLLLPVILFALLTSVSKSMSVTPSSKTTATLGAPALRTVATAAAQHDESISLDVTGILWLEHINLVVGDTAQAEHFYLDFLGLTRDPDAKFHCNLGQQQFHLAAANDDQPAQRVTGSIGLAVPSLASIRARVTAAEQALVGTLFAVLEDDNSHMTVRCPWGNTIHLYAVEDDATLADTTTPPNDDAPPSQQKMVRLHAPGGAYATHRMSVRGQPGIRYIEIACAEGSARQIAEFYRELLQCSTMQLQQQQKNDRTVVTVTVGPGVHLLFVETAAPHHLDNNKTDDAMHGVHICIYTGPGFHALYNRLDQYGLIWTNPRFLHLDRCDTWEEARASRTLRFKDVIDVSSQAKVLELEHETRPMRHGQFMKVPKYIAK